MRHFAPVATIMLRAFRYRARSCFNLMQAAFNRCRDQFARALAVDHINVVFINMNFQRTCQFLAFGLRYRNVVFDINGIEDLTTKTFAHQTGTDAFTCGSKLLPLHPPGRNQRLIRHKHHACSALLPHVFRASINFGDDFSQRHAALTKLFPVYEHCRNTHHVAIGNFVLEGAAVNCSVLDARVQYAHQVQRLHHIRAVVARDE